MHREDGERRAARLRALVIGAAGSMDIESIPSATDACLLTPNATPANAAGYYCTFPNGGDYPSRKNANENDSLTKGKAGNVSGGPTVGAVRVMLTVDYAASASFLVGVRVGYTMLGYPRHRGDERRARLHEAHLRRAPRVVPLGDQPLARGGFAPMVFAGGGVGEYYAKQSVQVWQNQPPLARSPARSRASRGSWAGRSSSASAAARATRSRSASRSSRI